MPPKRKASDWESELRNAIDNGEPDAVRAIESSLVELQRRAQERLISLQQKTGTGVCMVDSNQTQDQDLGYNMCSRSVEASFTAGPKAMPFSISFENEDVEGDQTIRIESELFIFEDGECGEVADDEIEKFLEKAGLQEAQPQRATDDDFSDPAERRRWVYADVVYDAIELVIDKHGSEDSCGVGLGMCCEDIYGWLGLDY